MSTPRFGALLGLALGAIWAVADFEGAVLAGFLTLIGYLAPTLLGYIAPTLLEGRIDLTGLLRQEPDTPRQRTKLQ